MLLGNAWLLAQSKVLETSSSSPQALTKWLCWLIPSKMVRPVHFDDHSCPARVPQPDIDAEDSAPDGQL